MKRGLSNLVAFVIVIMMTLTVAASFYYWVSGTQSEAMGTTEAFTEDLQTQVLRRAESIIDLYYKTDKEKNINNFGEVRQTICAEDRSLNTAEADISMELYRGYGSDLELICAVNDFDGSVVTSTDYVFGVLGGRTSSQTGITGIKCSDTTCEEVDWTSMSVSNEFASYSNFSFYVLESFVEGGDHIDEPRNLLLMGQGYNGSQFDSIILILNSSFEGKRYDLFPGGYLGGSSSNPEYPGAIRDFWQEQGANLGSFEYFTRVGGQQIAGNCQNHPDWTHGICDPPWYLDCCDSANQYEGIVASFEKSYSGPEGGTYIISNMNITEITSITKIIRNSIDKYLIGGFITLNVTPPFDTVGKLYELTAGPPPAYTAYSSCPYDSSTFSSVLGITIDVPSCKNDADYELFDEPIDMVRHGDNVLIGVNGLNYSSGGMTCPGYDDGTYCWVLGGVSESCDVACTDPSVGSTCVGEGAATWNDDSSCTVSNNSAFGSTCTSCNIFGDTTLPGTNGNLCYARDTLMAPTTDCGLGPMGPIKQRTCACDNSVFKSSTSEIPWFLYTAYNTSSTTFYVPAFGSVSASDLDNYNLTDILSDGSQVYLLMANSSETKVYNLTVDLSTAVVSTVNSDTLSGFYGKTMAMKGGVLYVGGNVGTDARIYKYSANSFDGSYSFKSTSYKYVEQLTNFTEITNKKPYCSSGCDQTLSRGECAELVFKLENTDCDISSYNQGESFTMRLNIGRYFQDLQIFTKKGFDSDEVNDTVA